MISIITKSCIKRGLLIYLFMFCLIFKEIQLIIMKIKVVNFLVKDHHRLHHQSLKDPHNVIFNYTMVNLNFNSNQTRHH